MLRKRFHRNKALLIAHIGKSFHFGYWLFVFMVEALVRIQMIHMYVFSIIPSSCMRFLAIGNTSLSMDECAEAVNLESLHCTIMSFQRFLCLAPCWSETAFTYTHRSAIHPENQHLTGVQLADRRTGRFLFIMQYAGLIKDSVQIFTPVNPALKSELLDSLTWLVSQIANRHKNCIFGLKKFKNGVRLIL